MDKDLGDLRKADKEATVGATASSGAVPGDRAHIVEVIPRRTKTAPAPPSLASTRGAGAAAEVEGGGAGCKGSGSSSGTDGGSGADDRTPERGKIQTIAYGGRFGLVEHRCIGPPLAGTL